MSAKPFSRSFERVLRAPLRISPGPPSDFDTSGGPGAGGARKFFYETLMKVSVLHTYYNASDFLCPDFTFQPIPASAALMEKLGLLFRPEKTGFSVLYDKEREDSLLKFLRRQIDKRGEVWTRLSFQMILNNDYFVNFTHVPVATDPASRNFYFSNQNAHTSKWGMLLNPGAHVSGGQLLPVVPGQLAVPASLDGHTIDEIQVYDISGEEVLCVPRCVTEEAAKTKPPSDFTCKDKGTYRCTDTIQINFAALREDRYEIAFVDQKGVELGERQDVLWTAFYPMPLCFIDLLFTSPTGEDPEKYPVRDLFRPRDSKVVGATYTLRFERRSTLWNYYIVPPRPGWITDLKMRILPPIKARFAGPSRVVLPDGREAFKFSGSTSIPLQQQPACNFQLLGRHKHWPHEKVLVDRLPAASYRQILPKREGGRTRNYSDIYVYV